MTAAFAIVGAVITFFGIVLVASPDLLPGALWLGHEVRLTYLWLDRRLRKLLRRPPHVLTGSASLTGSLRLSSRLTATTGTSATTLEEKVDWLLRRDREAQQRESDLAERITELESTITELLAGLREELKGHVADTVAAAQADLRAVRIAGDCCTDHRARSNDDSGTPSGG